MKSCEKRISSRKIILYGIEAIKKQKMILQHMRQCSTTSASYALNT